MTSKRPSSQSTLSFGFYSIPEAARLLRCKPSLVRRWTSEAEGLVPRRFAIESGVLSFSELIELCFIQMFRDAGLSLQSIRKAATKASLRFQSDYPFSMKKFDTDGRKLFATLRHEERDKEMIIELENGQQVFESVVRPFFKKLEYQESLEPARFWPLDRSGGVVLDPLRQFGRPIIAKHGIPTRAIMDALKAGQGQSRRAVAEWFEIDLSDVEAAIAFERTLAA